MDDYTKLKDFRQVEDKLKSIGIDLTIIESLINFLDAVINEEIDVRSDDLSNLVIVIKRMLRKIILKYDKIEHILDL